jgi:hypothetical protein
MEMKFKINMSQYEGLDPSLIFEAVYGVIGRVKTEVASDGLITIHKENMTPEEIASIKAAILATLVPVQDFDSIGE